MFPDVPKWMDRAFIIGVIGFWSIVFLLIIGGIGFGLYLLLAALIG